MAFLAPALRWPDVLGVDATGAVQALQARMPPPLSEVSPELLFSILVSCSVIVVLTLLTTALQVRHPKTAVLERAHGKKRTKRTDMPTVLLAGPSGVGKSSLFSALAFHAVPSVHPSQRESESKVSVRAREADRTVVLVDTPGHPRIKDGILSEYIKQTDIVVFCVDAKEALRGNAGIGAAKEGSLTEAVDHLHELLLQIAKHRRARRKQDPAPLLVILLTRADLSPHTANVSLSSMSADESKRRSFLLARARTAIEVELGRRRAGMGFGSKRTTKVGGMAKVTGGQGESSVWASVKRLFTLSSSTDADADAEEDEEVIDYVDWDVLERSQSGATQSAGTSLEKLDADIVEDGKALLAFVSVGKERGWEEQKSEGLDELRRILVDA